MENEKHLEIYRSWQKPDNWAARKIGGGRLSGKTDVSPMWRIDVLTAKFGLCGIGWRPLIKRSWSEEGADGVKMAFVEMELQIKVDGMWSEGNMGIGGNTLVEKEKNGMYNNDEAYKMAFTDALSVCCKNIGIGGEVYRGNFDGSKYTGKNKNMFQEAEEEPQSENQTPTIEELRETRIGAVMKKQKCERDFAVTILDDFYTKKCGKKFNEITAEEI